METFTVAGGRKGGREMCFASGSRGDSVKVLGVVVGCRFRLLPMGDMGDAENAERCHHLAAVCERGKRQHFVAAQVHSCVMP